MERDVKKVTVGHTRKCQQIHFLYFVFRDHKQAKIQKINQQMEST